MSMEAFVLIAYVFALTAIVGIFLYAMHNSCSEN